MSGLLERIFPRSGASSQPKDAPTPGPGALSPTPQADTGETGVLPHAATGLPGQSPPAGLPGQSPPPGSGLPGQSPPPGTGSPGQSPPPGSGLPGQSPPSGPGLPGQSPPFATALPGQAPPDIPGAATATGGPGSADDGPRRKGLRTRRKSEPEGPGGVPAGRDAPTTGTAQLPVVPQVSLEPSVLEGTNLDSAGFASRPKLRRRLRYLRKLRELLLRDLGGFVFDARRFQRPRDDLVAAKIERLAGIDKEIAALESALDDRRPLLDLREPGIGGMCEKCGAFFSSTSRFCSECGTSLGGQGHSAPPAAGSPAPSKPARKSRASSKRARKSPTPSVPGESSAPASMPMSPAARLAVQAASSRGSPPGPQPPATQGPTPQPSSAPPPGGGLWSAPAPEAGDSPAPSPTHAPSPPAIPQDAGGQPPAAAYGAGEGEPRPQDDPAGPSSPLSPGDPLDRR